MYLALYFSKNKNVLNMKKSLLLFVLLLFSTSFFAQVSNQPTQFNNVCDDNNDGFASFYMQEIAYEIIDSNSNLTVTHHLTQSDASLSVNPLPNIYTNISNPQLIFARIFNASTNQVQIITYNLRVNPKPIVYAFTMAFCDSDGVNDGIAILPELSNYDSNFSPNNDCLISYYETPLDAEYGTNPILSTLPYLYNSQTTQMLFVRAQNAVTNCYAVSQFYILLQFCGSQAGTPVDLYSCNSPACYNLTQNNQNILGSLNPSDYALTYHTTASDAQTGINPILTTTQFCTNNVAEVIYARLLSIIDNSTQVFTFNLLVSVPPPAPSQTITHCSSDATSFPCWDLTSIIPNVTGGTNNSVTFYLTQQDASLGTNPISNPTCFISVVATPTIPPVYYRILYPQTGCFSIGTINLLTIACYNGGAPQNLIVCSENNTNGCFDLTVNNGAVLANLNPSENTVTYHSSLSDANAGINTLSSPFCVPFGTYTLYSRLASNDGLNYEVLPFTVSVQTYVMSNMQLQNIVQCDDDNNGTINYNLTVVQAQLNTTNDLSYYTSLSNAQNMSSPIGNPASWTTNVQTNPFAIFIRENVYNQCDIIYTLQVQGLLNCNLASTCSYANSLCSALGTPFANTTNVSSTGSYGCLNTAPNPTWFYLPVSQSGTIHLNIEQNSSITFNGSPSDVDYVAFGPFSDPVTPCNGQITANNIVSCSYSASATETPVIENAVAGQYYLIMVTNFSNQQGYIRISQLSGANEGAINCSGIRLNAFLDANNNGTKDTGEQNFPLGQFHYESNSNGTIHNIISSSGVYNIYDINPTNSYNVSYSINSAYTSLYNITTSSYNNLNVVGGGGMVEYYFPVTITQSYNDLELSLIPVNAPRPGFVYKETIKYTNNGNQTIASGTVTFTKDATLTITGNTQSGTLPTSSGFTYNFTNLLPFETRTMTVSMQVPNLPTVNLGALLTNSASIEPLAGDVVPNNNQASSAQIIIGSYDPNDKMESHGEEILFSSFSSNDYLTYTIRFENSGTASAINVKVNDILSNQLDENSLVMIGSSHNYVLDRVASGLSWKFDNIQLPPSITGTQTGKGYVTFKIKPKPGYSVGDIISNTAAIYFDYNPAIVTNTFNTKFVSALEVNEFENNDFIFYPNPTSDFVTISLKKETTKIQSIAVYDVLGKIILSQKPENKITQTIDLTSVKRGMYFVEVTTESNLKVIKKLLVK